jgi:outer membrane protein insertion porin family
MKKQSIRILLIAIVTITIATTGLWAADADPWYYGKRIAEFNNYGLQHVKESTILDLQYQYLGKNFSDGLFDELQTQLWEMDAFLYFLADANRTGEGGNELAIDFTFYELPYITEVVVEGNIGIKIKDILGAITAKESTFLDEQAIERSKEKIVGLYQQKGYAKAIVESQYVEDETTNTAIVTYTIDEGAQQRIGEILFEGNEAVGSDLLKKQLSSKAVSYFNSGYYNPNTVIEDTEQIISHYLTKGYIDAQVLDVKIEDISGEDEKYERLRLTYVIDEGQQWFFGGIAMEGNTVFSDEQFAALVTMKEGAALDVSRVQKEVERVTDLYWNNGYIFNLISSDEIRDTQTNTISYVLHVQENQQAIIEEVRIEGLTKTKSYVFERELAFGVGDIFSKEKLIRSAQNIYNTLIVTDVQFDIINGTEEGKVIPIFTVTEGNQMDIQFGATFGGNVDGFPVSGFLQWSDKNVGGTGRDLAIATNLSPDTQSINLSFSDGWVGNRRWSNGLSFNFERSEKSNALQRGEGSAYYTGHDTTDVYPLGYSSSAAYEAANQALPASQYLMDYTYYRISVGYNTGYTFMFMPGALTIGGGLTIGLNHATYEDNKYDPYEKLIARYHERWQFSNRLSLSFSWDGRDRIENTSRGYYLSQNFTYAGGILGGLSNYIRTSTSASAYTTLWSFTLDERPANVVLGATATVSAMLPQYHRDNDEKKWGWNDAKMGATRYEMLYIDGMNTGRGFPVIFDQAFLWDNQLSISWPLAQNVLAGEVYVSATGVSPTLKEIAPKDLGWYFSAGAGIKLKVPGFPLGLYLVKNATYINDQFAWRGGNFFRGKSDTSGLSLVLAITTTLY